MAHGKKTPIFDWATMEFKKDLNGSVETATGNAAVKETFFKAQQTRRGAYLIYADPEDPSNNHKYGSDLLNVLASNITGDMKESEIKRAVKEAGIYLEGVKNVYDIEISQGTNDETYIKAIVTTIYDDELPIEGIIFERG